MAMMHEKKSARENRGSANGRGESWYNSPLWDNVKAKQISTDVKVESLFAVKEELSEEEKQKEMRKRMFALAY